MRRMTFDEYDALCEQFEKSTYPCDNWWPSPKEIDEKIKGNIDDYIEFLIWIVETNEEPETSEEKESKRYINKILRENLELFDDPACDTEVS